MISLVTGGAGFIGSHLVERLLSEKHQVVVLDNFSTGRWQNLEPFKHHRNLHVKEADISKLDEIEPYFKGVDWVFHLAALADIVPSVQNPISYHQANVDGTCAVVEAARRNKIKKFLYTASSSCYGIPDLYPTPETAAVRPQYPYALTKYLGEQIALHWGQVYKLPVISLRLFNVYGPRSRTSGTYGAVFGVFLAQKLHGKPFTVVGDGTQTRDFIYVTDVVNAFILAAQSNFEGEIFNVGSGSPQSVNHLVELLKGEVVHIPKRPGEPDCTHADIAKIKTMLQWEPKVNFEQGVNILLKQIDYWKEAPVWTTQTISHATQDWFRFLSPTS